MCCLSPDSAGGELILGWRKSALFLKSPLSERQQAASSDFLKTVLAEFRQPRSSPRRSPEQTGTRLPGVRHPTSTTKIHPKNSTLLNFYASSNTPTLTTLPPNHKQSQPFLPAIQRSADGSSNSRQTTLPTTLKDQPGRCVRSVTGSAGGELILGWWKSALFFKSSLFERSEFGLLENAFSRFPAA